MGFFYTLTNSFIKKPSSHNRLCVMFTERRNNFVNYEFNVQGTTIVATRRSEGIEIMSGLLMEKS